ncbi:Serine carboxypeptidase-like [Thalictrum thalictroides]|uniref:Serine carboxypeptidase-like n=1 Tax=Thalictrum thalictroides TaxID=46969 RepID=A0A7J6WL96_THATH|nr:Serine carboxypeptidase-like [Thalictrum thalictroides]
MVAGIDVGNKPLINLKGYLLGNPTTDGELETNSKVQFAYGMGLLSDELFESTKKHCGGNYVNVNPSNVKCTKHLQAISECTSGVNTAHILEPRCILVTPKPKKVNSSSILRSPPQTPGFECRSYGYMLSYYWANDDRVQKALYVRKGTIPEWIRCNYGGLNYLSDVKSSTAYHGYLSGKRRYRSLVYSGDHDMLVPFLSTQAWIRSLNYSISDEWRPWSVDGQVGGYTRTYANNMTFATVKGGVIVQHISDGVEVGNKPPINLKGYLLGNPVTDGELEANSKVPFAYGMGLISDELFESTKKHCGGIYVNVNPSNVECTKHLQAISECTSGVNTGHILEPQCIFATPKSQEINSSRILRSPPHTPGFECRSYGYMLSYYWANDDRVRKALNVRKGTIQEWIRCNYGGLNYLSDVKSSTAYHGYLSGKRQYRSLIYSGDHDIIVPFLSTQAWIRSLNCTISDDWRPWTVDGQVGGYTRTYTNNITFTTIKGGGHTAPEYRPKECFTMFNRWLSYEAL